MITMKHLLSTGIVGLIALASACSSSDDSGSRGASTGAQPPAAEAPPNAGNAGGAGGGSGGSGNPGSTPVAATFPVYVERLIETNTNDTAMAEPEAAWGSIPDDANYVTPAAFFQ